MVVENVPVPSVYNGFVIGKGGRNLNELQSRHGVTISLADGSATVAGVQENVKKCIAAIGAIVTYTSGLARSGSWRGRSPLVPRAGECPLCETKIKRLDEALRHLQSEEHRQAVINAKPALAEVYEGFPMELDLDQLAQLLSKPPVKRFHELQGWAVDEILAAIPWQQKSQEVRSEMDQIAEDPDWLKIRSRVVVHWDDTCADGRTHGLAEAPEISEMLRRCSIGGQPPMVTIPSGPKALPPPVAPSEADNRKAAHEYPADPGTSRLGLAVLKKLGQSVSDYDFICGTSFMRALAGDGARIDRTYYIQHFQQTICVLTWHQRFDLNQMGVRLESLICGEAAGHFEAATTVTIDQQKLLVVSDVDAIDSQGALVEIKSFQTQHGKASITSSEVLLQIALNGSEHILACEVCGENMVDAEWLSVDQVRREHMQDFSRDGQHVRYMLDKVSEFMKQHDGPEIWKMSFDIANGKLPSFELAEGVEVLPAGLTND